MRLLIISHTPHYLLDNELVGWGATIREIDHLSQLFDHVTHIAPVHPDPAPGGALPYESDRVEVRPVKPAGGKNLLSKLGIFMRVPSYAIAILQEAQHADVVHVRCPANISLIALLILTVLSFPRRRWFKYAGNWQPQNGEPWSYRFQRWWLTYGPHRGWVTVNGAWPNQPSHIKSFTNPCLTLDELETGKRLSEVKQLTTPLQLLYVGRLETAKGVGHILDIAAKLKERGVAFQLDFVGDSPERPAFEHQCKSLGIESMTRFHGWKAKNDLGAFYAQAHIILLPSRTEGWPKVLSEALAYNVVPVASNVGSIPQYFEAYRVGRTHAADDTEGFVQAVQWYADHPEVWKKEACCGLSAAKEFTYPYYLDKVSQLLSMI